MSKSNPFSQYKSSDEDDTATERNIKGDGFNKKIKYINSKKIKKSSIDMEIEKYIQEKNKNTSANITKNVKIPNSWATSYMQSIGHNIKPIKFRKKLKDNEVVLSEQKVHNKQRTQNNNAKTDNSPKTINVVTCNDGEIIIKKEVVSPRKKDIFNIKNFVKVEPKNKLCIKPDKKYDDYYKKTKMSELSLRKSIGDKIKKSNKVIDKNKDGSSKQIKSRRTSNESKSNKHNITYKCPEKINKISSDRSHDKPKRILKNDKNLSSDSEDSSLRVSSSALKRRNYSDEYKTNVERKKRKYNDSSSKPLAEHSDGQNRAKRCCESSLSRNNEDEHEKLIKSVVEIKEKYKRGQLLLNEETKEKIITSKEDFDLRCRLNRANRNLQNKKNKSILKIENESTLQEKSMDNLIITINQNCENIAENKPKSTKTKSRKKLKFTIKVVCHEVDESASDNSDVDMANSGNDDLSFLDDFNVDEIVDSLKPSRDSDISCQNVKSTSTPISENRLDASIVNKTVSNILENLAKSKHTSSGVDNANKTESNDRSTINDTNAKVSLDNVIKTENILFDLTTTGEPTPSNILNEINTLESNVESSPSIIKPRSEPDSIIGPPQITATNESKNDQTSIVGAKNNEIPANIINALKSNWPNEATKTSEIITPTKPSNDIKKIETSSIQKSETKIIKVIPANIFELIKSNSLSEPPKMIEVITPSKISNEIKNNNTTSVIAAKSGQVETLTNNQNAITTTDASTKLNNGIVVTGNTITNEAIVNESAGLMKDDISQNISTTIKKEIEIPIPTEINKVTITQTKQDEDISPTVVKKEVDTTIAPTEINKPKSVVPINVISPKAPNPIKKGIETSSALTEVNKAPSDVPIQTNKTIISQKAPIPVRKDIETSAKTNKDPLNAKTKLNQNADSPKTPPPGKKGSEIPSAPTEIKKPTSNKPIKINIIPRKPKKNTTETPIAPTDVTKENTSVPTGNNKHGVTSSSTPLTASTTNDKISIASSDSNTETPDVDKSEDNEIIQSKTKDKDVQMDNETEPTVIDGLKKSFITSVENRMLAVVKESYKITMLIKNGKFSQIIKCKDSKDKNYALKILSSEYRHLSLDIEIENLLKLLQRDIPKDKHLIVHTFSAFNVGRSRVLLMEYFHTTLHQVLYHYDREKPFHIDAVREIARQIISALKMLRDINVIHANIRLSHILIDESKMRVKLCGFDESYNFSFPTVLLPAVGTMYYRPPEIILGYPADYSIDVWSTAQMLFELTTRKKLFYGCSNNEILYQQMRTFGNIPFDMLQRSVYNYRHFYGGDFIRKLENSEYLIPSFYKTQRLREELLSSYWKYWSHFRTTAQEERDLQKLTELQQLLEKMMKLDPRQRLPIEFICADPFIYEWNI